jgi:hypothetical protein
MTTWPTWPTPSEHVAGLLPGHMAALPACALAVDRVHFAAKGRGRAGSKGQQLRSVRKQFFKFFANQLSSNALQSAALGVKPAIEDVVVRNFLAFCLTIKTTKSSSTRGPAPKVVRYEVSTGEAGGQTQRQPERRQFPVSLRYLPLARRTHVPVTTAHNPRSQSH